MLTVDEVKEIVIEIHEMLEYWQRPYTDEDHGDCGNWESCLDNCAIKRLRDCVGIKPQEDGGITERQNIDKENEND